MINPCDNCSMYSEDNGIPCYCQTRKVYSNSLKKEIPPIKPDPRLDVFISGEKKAEREEKERVADAKAMKDYNMLCIKYRGTVYILEDRDWDIIARDYEYECWDDHEGYVKTFSQYVKELIELKIAEKENGFK